MQGTYYRWAKSDHVLRADILGTETEIFSNPDSGKVSVRVPDHPIDPDTARMIGVRLIEAATLADAGRSIREL